MKRSRPPRPRVKLNRDAAWELLDRLVHKLPCYDGVMTGEMQGCSANFYVRPVGQGRAPVPIKRQSTRIPSRFRWSCQARVSCSSLQRFRTTRHVPEKPGAPERAALGIPFPIDERQEQPFIAGDRLPAHLPWRRLQADSGRARAWAGDLHQAGRWEAPPPLPPPRSAAAPAPL